MFERLLQDLLARSLCTREAIDARLEALVASGFLPRDEARRLAERLQERLRAGLGPARGAYFARALDLPSRADWEDLRARLERIEAQLKARGETGAERRPD